MNEILVLLAIPYLTVLYLWTAGAFCYDVGQRGRKGWICFAIWTLVFVLILVLIKPFWMALMAITLVVVGVIAWWSTQKPSNDRVWEPNFEKLACITIDGDKFTIQNIRNTQYRSLTDYTTRYETRSFKFSELKAVDVVILDWGANASHPIVIFVFENGQQFSVSIEVRYRLGEPYELLRNLYRQNEIIYVVADERDAILLRTKYAEGQCCYLYRLQTAHERQLQLLNEYVEQINELVENPRWYNIVTCNCTTSIFRYRKEKIGWDWRILFNGKLDQLLYDRERLYQELPFAQLKEASRINDRANSAQEETFHSEIRTGLPGFD